MLAARQWHAKHPWRLPDSAWCPVGAGVFCTRHAKWTQNTRRVLVIGAENGSTSASRFGVFVHHGYAPHCSLNTEPTVKQLAGGRAFAFAPAGILAFCTGLSIAAQNTRRAAAPIGVEWQETPIQSNVFRTSPPTFCRTAHQTACKMSIAE